MRKLKKVLIANRGEIALRVVRACAEVGLESVAVYSEADRTSLHVRAADEAYLIGPPQSADSYLRVDRLLDVARKSGADAVHPGYGFLAENADFAQAVLEAGLTWIGPEPRAMRMLGDKLEARRTAQAAGVPTVPGTDVATDDLQTALDAAQQIGYPVLIKASAGGGGKGMRIVSRPEELEAALRGAQSEAQASFGSGTVYIEKYLESVRHVEIQLLGDTHGNVIHLGERECSVQRRYQKLIEESPSVAVDRDLRERMGSVAVAAAKAVGYSSAGTVEFLLDKFKNFYFLEVNTRLQVEHPVTELVTGVDLVLEQFRIASGRPLRLKQSDVRFNGHAMECRIAAEDPFNNFAPSLGTIAAVSEPSGAGVRVDSSIYAGGKVSIYYDPMIAKLIVWAPSRAHAILRMRRALREYRIAGIQTNIPFHLRVMQSLDFQRGRLDTKFVERLLGDGARSVQSTDDDLELIAAMSAALVLDRKRQAGAATAVGPAQNSSADGNAWRRAGRRQGLR
ncbi:MAG TPA: acetyl-CoA carboxylase biotin carboxylase subunit [Chloroflexia bacterium]|nr:acetyl-CoA carboxylase biotin carboxylase subunit [Chloroflexia bacterium]